LVFTGQHPNLDPAEFGLVSYEAIALSCPGRANPHRHVGEVTAAVSNVIGATTQLIIVQGDTSSAMGGALAAAATGVPVAHVEAGLRTFDPDSPWPEEEYRTAIDAEADLLFAPTLTSAANLAREEVRGTVHVTGNTSIDALFGTLRDLPLPRPRDRTRPQLLVTCHRRENWGERLQAIAGALVDIARSGSATTEVLLHPNGHVADAMRKLLAGRAGIKLLEPCSHRELLQRMRMCDLILSDSGGIQEEAPALGVPLLVMRDKTERPEGIETGNTFLVGCDRDVIVGTVQALLSDPSRLAAMARPALPFGDGRAAPRIAAIIERWLAARRPVRRRA
jgi:UDP-N-acetylglucosamine 2-epimerase (non-hydrolysing)